MNIAQRLASYAEGSQILMTETVYHEVADTIPAKAEKARILRGIQGKIKTYSIEAPVK